jgi:hypothetical protein
MLFPEPMTEPGRCDHAPDFEAFFAWLQGAGDLYIASPANSLARLRILEHGVFAVETQYFCDPFEASAWRSRWVEPMEKKVSLK